MPSLFFFLLKNSAHNLVSLGHYWAGTIWSGYDLAKLKGVFVFMVQVWVKKKKKTSTSYWVKLKITLIFRLILPIFQKKKKIQILYIIVSYKCFCQGKERKNLWKCAVLALQWAIWEERLSRVFDRKIEENIVGLWDRVRYFAFLWDSASNEFRDSTFFLIEFNWESVVG